MKHKPWLVFALLTTFFWGIWGAWIELPGKAGFPATLGYVVWAITMIPPAFVALRIARWNLETGRRAILFGSLIGLTGAIGQLILFQALKTGPAYLVFPIVSLSPVVTVLLSLCLLKEKASRKSWIGIAIALVAIPLLSYQPSGEDGKFGSLWIVLALGVLFCWGLQAYWMKLANNYMRAESIFFYMMLTGLLLTPVALAMTNFNQPINWGWKGPYLAFAIQILNAVGALLLVYAFRYGRAIIVSPLTNAGAPVITVVLSLLIYGAVPHPIILTGLILALISIVLLAG